MYKKRVFFQPFVLAVFSLLLFLSLPSLVSAQGPSRLPEMPGWISGELKTTNLDTVSGNQGTWFQRNYRSVTGAQFHATLITGKAANIASLPSGNIETTDGLIGSGSSYRTSEVGGFRAIAEVDPVLGASVVVKLADGYLTLESGPYGMTAESLLGVANELIQGM